MKKGGDGGGSTMTGLNFEGKVDFLTLIDRLPNYRSHKSVTMVGHEIHYGDTLVGDVLKNMSFIIISKKKASIGSCLYPRNCCRTMLCWLLFVKPYSSSR